MGLEYRGLYTEQQIKPFNWAPLDFSGVTSSGPLYGQERPPISRPSDLVPPKLVVDLLQRDVGVG